MEIPFNNFIKNCEVTRNNKHEFDIVGFEEEIFFRVDISNGWKIVRNEGVELPSSDAATQILFNKIDVLIEEEAPLEMEYESPYSEYDNQI